MLKRPAVLAALLLSAVTLAAKQNYNPPRLLIRTICLGDRDCETINAITARIVPLLGTDSQAGTLTVNDADPIAPCLQRLDRDRDIEVAHCVEKTLFGNSAVEAMTAGGYDGYLLFILRYQPRESAWGQAVVLTPAGQSVNAAVNIGQARPDGSPLGYLKLPLEQQALFMVWGPFADAVERAGLIGLPPHRPIATFITPQGEATHLGSIYVPPAEPTAR